MHSDFATVRFFIRTKVVVTGPGGTDTLELEPRELTVVPTSEADRKVAMEKWAEQKELAQRSKSKSPWRRRGEDGPNAEDGSNGKPNEHGLPSPPQTPAQSSDGGDHRTSSTPIGSKPRKKTPRRPHTSAGPRDKSNFAFSAPAAIGLRSEPDHGDTPSTSSSRASESSTSSANCHSSSAAKRLRETGLGESMLYAVDRVRGKSRSRDGDARRDRVAEDGGREEERDRRERLKKTGFGLQLGLEVEQVRAWEEELARIELQSRRSSVGMFGALGMSRKATNGG